MKISVCECNKGTSIEETELETFLDECQIVIIEDKSVSLKKPMSKVIIRDENIAFAFHYLLKGNKEYYISANVQKENGNWVFHVSISSKKIAKRFKNTIEYKGYKQQKSKI